VSGVIALVPIDDSFHREVFGTFDCILDVNSFGTVNEEDRQR